MKGRRSGAPDHFFRLKAAALERLNGRAYRWPSRDEFVAFFRDDRRYSGSVEREWSGLVAGAAVPPVIAHAFAEYMGRWPGREAWGFDDYFEPARAPQSEGAWKSPQTLLDALTHHLHDSDEMYFHNRLLDSLTAARMVAHTLGSKLAVVSDDIGKAACIRRGEAAMGRDVEGYARWLRDVSAGDAHFRNVMFFVRGAERVGVMVILPLKEEVYHAFCRGEVGIWEIGPGQLAARSRFVLINAMSDGEDFPRLSARDKTSAQARTMIYMIAFLTRGTRPYRPRIASFATNDHYRKLFRNQGFAETGGVMKGLGYRIVEMKSPAESERVSLRTFLPYSIFRVLFRACWLVNRRRWRREDRHAAKTSP